MNWQPWLQPPVLTSLILGGYGAIISTIVWLRGWYKDARKLQVVVGTEELSTSPHRYYFVRATNVGFRPVVIDRIMFEAVGKGHLFDCSSPRPENTKLPITLEDGQFAERHFREVDLERQLWGAGFRSPLTMRAVVFDAAEKMYRGTTLVIAPHAEV